MAPPTDVGWGRMVEQCQGGGRDYPINPMYCEVRWVFSCVVWSVLWP